MKREGKTKEGKLKPFTVNDVPEEVLWQVKAKAAASHMTIKSFVHQALQRAISEEG